MIDHDPGDEDRINEIPGDPLDEPFVKCRGPGDYGYGCMNIVARPAPRQMASFCKRCEVSYWRLQHEKRQQEKAYFEQMDRLYGCRCR